MIWKCIECDCSEAPCIVIDTLGNGSPCICPMAQTLTPVFVEIPLTELNSLIVENLQN